MEERLTRTEQKNLALARMRQMKIYDPYIKIFDKSDVVTMYERFGGYYATASNGEKELEDKIHEFEARTGNLVYAVTHNFTNYGEMYSFLIVSSYREDETKRLLEEYDGHFYPMAYVWNKDCEECSEYGTIGVKSYGGGLNRVE